MTALTPDQALAIRNAINDLQRCIEAIDAEDLGEMLVAREFALASSTDLVIQFGEQLKEVA